MSRIAATFEALQARRRKALIPFITAGDPSIELTVPLMHALVEAGADIIELGMPFSDPMADGPTIQRSSERALKTSHQPESGARRGGAVPQPRTTRTPVVLMGYANPIEAMGVRALRASRRTSAGVDGVLVVDYPPEEGSELHEQLRRPRHRQHLPAVSDLRRCAHGEGRRASRAATSTTYR